MRKEKLIKYGSIVVRVIIAILFLLAGSGKFQTDTTMSSNFRNWNLGIAMMFIVGAFEVLGSPFPFDTENYSVRMLHANHCNARCYGYSLFKC